MLSIIYQFCSDTGLWSSICVSNSMYVGQLNILSVVNRQRYVNVLPVLTKLACKRLVLQYQVEKLPIMPNVLVVAIEDLQYRNYLLKSSGALYTS